MKYSINYMVAKTLKALGLKFDPSKCEPIMQMQQVINDLGPSGIHFAVTIEPNGEWMAESVNLPGIITGGYARDDINEMIKDAIFTYFGIPAAYCDDAILRSSGEPVVTRQEMFLATAKA